MVAPAGNRLEGIHFRRPQVVEPYIVDFYCHRAEPLIEVDGGVHQDQGGSDRLREPGLQARGLRVMRFTNNEVIGSLDLALEAIRYARERRSAGTPPCT